MFKDIHDNGGNNVKVHRDTTSDVYVVFNPNNVKSADSVTYDDNGNVIPLSERFNEAKSDIRYQARSTKRKYAKHGGIFSDSLASDEWAKFTNAMTTGIDAGLRISDNAILVECEEKSDYQYKLVIYDNEIEDNPLKSVYAIGNIDYNKTTANEIAYFIKKLEDKGYDSKKYLRNYSEIILKSLDMYSDYTVLKVSNTLTSDEALLKIEEILKSNPTEEELLKILDKEFPTAE